MKRRRNSVTNALASLALLLSSSWSLSWSTALPSCSAFVGSSPRLAQKSSSKLSAAPSSPSPRYSGRNGEGPSSDGNALVQRRDVLNVATHILACTGAAAIVSTYEDYDCTNLKPQPATIRDDRGGSDGSRSMIGSATRGLGWGESDRDVISYKERFGEQAGREIRSYNEVMLRHRSERIPRWRSAGSIIDDGRSSTPGISEAGVRDSVGSIYDALRAISNLKAMANEYEWDDMDELLRKPVLTSDLEVATSRLRAARAYLSDDARETIGFDWGACAWRHCGATADAQESLAELRNSLGLFEPFECLFVLDIVERSLRDVLTVIPAGLHPKKKASELERYIPYQAQGDAGNGGDGEGGGGDGATIDVDFLGALSALRNDLLSE